MLCTLPLDVYKQYVLEYIFDNLSLVKQDTLLQYTCEMGIQSDTLSLTASQVKLFKNVISHRYAEKGSKQSDVFPKHAHSVLSMLFPKHAGKVCFRFPLNPSIEQCKLETYFSQQQEKQSSVFEKKYVYSTHSHEHMKAIHYFSPIPVHIKDAQNMFYSSTHVHNASTMPLAGETTLFGYNEILNYKHKQSAYGSPMLCTTDNLLGVSLQADMSQDILQQYIDSHPSPSIFKQPLHSIESTLGVAFSSFESTYVRLNSRTFFRYLLLRHRGIYLRFFYPGIVSKHPNKEHYASYKHSENKKLL